MAEQPVTIFSPPRELARNPSPAAPVRSSTPVQSAAAATVVSSPPESEPQRRWAAEREAIKAADPWQQDPSKVVMRKDADGVVRAYQRDGQGTPVPDAAGEQPQPAAAVDGGKLKVGEYELSADDIKTIMAEKAARDSRTASVPERAQDYTLDLGNFELPAGITEWKWNTEDPVSAALLGQAKQLAHELKLDQPSFSKLLGLHAAYQIADEQRFNEAKKVELAKLGPNAATRVDAIGTWLESQLGSELATALRKSTFTATQVRAYERLLRNFVSQGVTGNPGGARDGAHGQPERISDADYSKLSYHEKLEYASRFQQPAGR
jgi:hypothetical protein